MRDHSEESFSDGTPVPAEEPPAGKGKGPSQAQILVGMAEDTYRLIRADDGRAYAVPRLGPQIAVPLASKSENSLRTRLAASLHRQTGQVASSSNLSDAITVLIGEAADLEPVPVWLRAARHDGTVVIDMGTGTGQCIIITGRGWSAEPGSPVIFRRSELTHPLAEPQRGGTLDGLRELINLPDDDYRLAIGWVIAAYFTGIPHPILLVQGEQGTAKSGLIRTLLALVDPQPAAERTPPKDQREWAIFGRASWAFSYENITDIPPWLSNALCKGVTGDAVLQRVLHSDDDIGVYSFQRVIALTTIAIGHDLAGDLADRTLLIEPEVIEVRRDEEDVQAARAAALPSALGAVLDLVAGVLAELPHTTVANAPRMADFAKVLAALDAVTGWGTLASYRAKVASLALSLIEGSTLARALYRLATAPSPGGLDRAPWEGTATELLAALRGICTDAGLPASELPAGERSLGQKVREIAPALRKAGVDIRPGKRTEHRRPLIISKTAHASDQAHTLSSLLKRTDVMLSAGPVPTGRWHDISVVIPCQPRQDHDMTPGPADNAPIRPCQHLTPAHMRFPARLTSMTTHRQQSHQTTPTCARGAGDAYTSPPSRGDAGTRFTRGARCGSAAGDR